MPYSSSDNKDQLRSLKSAMQSRLSSTFRTRRTSHVGQNLVISPSPTDSECSTLVDFVADYTDSTDPAKIVYEDAADRAVMLEEENCAWMNEKAYKAALKAHQKARAVPPYSKHSYGGVAEMIDEEDRAWAMPSKSTKLHLKPSNLFSSHRRQKVPNPKGLEAQMLDPEDRAWM